MVRVSVLCALTLTTGCSLFPDLGGLSSDAGSNPDTTTGSDAALDAAKDTGIDASDDAGSDAPTCSCTNLVSAYTFSNPNDLGHDVFGNNDMEKIYGTPKQSTTTPPGLGGFSIQLDGSSSVCIDNAFTFNSTADHTLCWWSQPAALADQTNQFAQNCGYDTWTGNSGADYVWRINNCNTGTAADFDVPNIFSVGKWVEICQTYTSAQTRRSVIINGQTSQKDSLTDQGPIVEVLSSSAPWCIGSYDGGGFWTGLIYQPMWFDRVLTDTEIQDVYKNPCCLP